MGISLCLLWLPAELEWVEGVDVAVCYTFVSLPQFWVLLQTLSGGRSTPVRLRLDFQSVLELCDQLFSQTSRLETIFGRFAALQLGLLQLVWALVSVCEVERKRAQWIVFASHSLSSIVVLFSFNKSVFGVSAVRYLLQELVTLLKMVTYIKYRSLFYV